MPQILVWKCPHTGTLFESKTKYQTHLKKLSVRRVADRKAAAFKKERADFFAHMRATVRTPDELVEFVKQYWDKFCENADLQNAWRKTNKKKLPHPKIEYMNFKLTWSDSVSNTHSAPFGKQTNWGGQKKDVPRGYPGWHGVIHYNVSEYQSIHGSDMWKGTGVHTSAGGYNMWEGTGVHTSAGGYASEYYYSIEMFAEDWPAMLVQREKEIVWKTLKEEHA